MGDGTRLSRAGYQRLVDEDLEWLSRQPRTLEREHIALVLRASVALCYPEDTRPAVAAPVDTEPLFRSCATCGMAVRHRATVGFPVALIPEAHTAACGAVCINSDTADVKNLKDYHCLMECPRCRGGDVSTVVPALIAEVQRLKILEPMLEDDDRAIRRLRDKLSEQAATELANAALAARADAAERALATARAALDAVHARCDAAERERDALREAHGHDTTWPLASVLERLAGAVDHLFDAHECDFHGYEEFAAARDSAREILRRIEKMGGDRG